MPESRRRRRRPDVPDDVRRELRSLGGPRAERSLEQMARAADAFGRGRDRDALRDLRPLRDALPDSPSVRELLGLAQYRLGNYRAAAKELEAFRALGGSTDQHPVLMDCYRAQHRWKKVDELWSELGAASPSAALVTEGRIVAAGALADRGQLDDALALLRRRADDVARPKPHHLRLWYALGDLEERAGNHARARTLFERVRRRDPDFADVTTRHRALG